MLSDQKKDDLPVNLQDDFLRLSKGKQVSIYLVNGICLKGLLGGYDKYVVFIAGAKPQMIYKHAIATVVPDSG